MKKEVIICDTCGNILNSRNHYTKNGKDYCDICYFRYHDELTCKGWSTSKVDGYSRF